MFPRRSFQLHKNRHCFRLWGNMSMISNPAFFKSIYVDLGYVSTASHLRSCPRWRIRMSSTSSKVERPSAINNKLKGWQTYVVSSCCEAIYQVVWDICHQELRWEFFSSHPTLCKVIEQGSHKELTAKEAFWFERRSFQALTYQELPEQLARAVCTKHWQQRKEQWWRDRSIPNELQSNHGAETALWNRYLGLPGFRQRRERAEGQSCCHCSLVRKRKKRMDFDVAPAPQRSGCLIECAARLHCWVLMASLATFSIDYLWIWHKHSFLGWRQEVVFGFSAYQKPIWVLRCFVGPTKPIPTAVLPIFLGDSFLDFPTWFTICTRICFLKVSWELFDVNSEKKKQTDLGKHITKKPFVSCKFAITGRWICL